jgi:hypothetical protein
VFHPPAIFTIDRAGKSESFYDDSLDGRGKSLMLRESALIWMFLACGTPLFAQSVSLNGAVVLVRPGSIPNAERTAATVLREELEKRTGIGIEATTHWPAGKAVIAITSTSDVPAWDHRVPAREGEGLPEKRPEGYRLFVEAQKGTAPVVWVLGADARGALFGVGQLLRRIDWARGKLEVAAPLDIATTPAYAIRGHQLGYRAQANSYDAWSPHQFEQYIRELTFFGVNSIEGIPFQDDRPTPVMKYSRREMNRAIGEICDRYGLDYWVWAPADFDLRDTPRRNQELERYAEFFRDTLTLTGVFFPGGDPGHNPPELVFPFLEDMAKLLRPSHPQVKIWISLQWFTAPQIDAIHNYIGRNAPEWFAGLVAGPSGPSIAATRQRLAKQYRLRLYPDLSHNVRCQFEVPEWDQAYSLTEGREAVNPRPAEYTALFRNLAPWSDGFISYSDGVHDDVNKAIWSALAWDPSLSTRDILIDYARVFFGPVEAERAADAMLALEKNWHGPLVDNGAVEGTLSTWQQLERGSPELRENWRWQMCLLRANYDACVRCRLIHETDLEARANAILAEAPTRGADNAMTAAMATLNDAVIHTAAPDLRQRISDLCDELFHSIGLQTSVKKYYAIGEERGAVLDLVDYPLNNRWWLEDEFQKTRQLGSEEEKCSRLHVIATWENPAPGSYYDDVGNVATSPHVVRTEVYGPGMDADNGHTPTFWWWDEGMSRARLSWQVTMWPERMVYGGLDPKGTYVVRSTGYKQALLRINGERIQPMVDGQEMGAFKEFPVPPELLKGGRLILTWDPPAGEENLNWRDQSRLAEVWLIKKDHH